MCNLALSKIHEMLSIWIQFACVSSLSNRSISRKVASHYCVTQCNCIFVQCTLKSVRLVVGIVFESVPSCFWTKRTCFGTRSLDHYVVGWLITMGNFFSSSWRNIVARKCLEFGGSVLSRWVVKDKLSWRGGRFQLHTLALNRSSFPLFFLLFFHHYHTVC